MDTASKIYVAGHRGLVGSAIVKKLLEKGFKNIVVKTHAELDLTKQSDVENFFKNERPDHVILAAAKVGGIYANSNVPAEFIFNNLSIALNVIEYSYKYKVRKLINLGSSCIYPKMAPQPLKEDYLLTGSLESTNEAYAIAKIAAIKLCRYYNQQYGTNFISVMPTNLYGPQDNYNLNNSHVLPAIIRKIHEAKMNDEPVELWGDGSPLREFLYSEDLSDAVIFIMENFDFDDIGELINIGTGKEISIRELAEFISNIIGFKGKIAWDTSKPNGTPRKLLDVSRMKSLGWEYKTDLESGIRLAYKDFINRYRQINK